jgi:hypothetical protein
MAAGNPALAPERDDESALRESQPAYVSCSRIGVERSFSCAQGKRSEFGRAGARAGFPAKSAPRADRHP